MVAIERLPDIKIDRKCDNFVVVLDQFFYNPHMAIEIIPLHFILSVTIKSIPIMYSMLLHILN